MRAACREAAGANSGLAVLEIRFLGTAKNTFEKLLRGTNVARVDADTVPDTYS